MSIEAQRYFDNHTQTSVTGNRLPHWEQDLCTYFVTFRTADSLPQGIAAAFHRERDSWLSWNPKPWNEVQEREYWERFGQQTEKWLDECHGSCLLRKPESASFMADALRFHEGKLCTQMSWIVMPNHVHTLFSLHENASLSKLLHSWKSYTANKINRFTSDDGAFWQKDYFDRLIRSAEHFWRCARYIRNNPGALAAGDYVLWEAPWVSEGLDAQGSMRRARCAGRAAGRA
jgi:REP element-mobilizing transposase RayT